MAMSMFKGIRNHASWQIFGLFSQKNGGREEKESIGCFEDMLLLGKIGLCVGDIQL